METAIVLSLSLSLSLSFVPGVPCRHPPLGSDEQGLGRKTRGGISPRGLSVRRFHIKGWRVVHGSLFPGPPAKYRF